MHLKCFVKLTGLLHIFIQAYAEDFVRKSMSRKKGVIEDRKKPKQSEQCSKKHL